MSQELVPGPELADVGVHMGASELPLPATSVHDVPLPGCRPEPLATYLKALGVLRLVAEQADPHARGYWSNETFVLQSRLSQEELVGFFLERYAPSPIVAPWNAGSGFYFREEKVKDPATGKNVKTGRRTEATAATRAIDTLLESTSDRLSLYRDVCGSVRALLEQNGLSAAPSDVEKTELVQTLRNCLPDAAMEALDALAVLTGDKPSYPPLLGTGGNDGNLEFTNNFIQRLNELFDGTGHPSVLATKLIADALFGLPSDGLSGDCSIGQFHPAGAGGANLSAGYDGGTLVNPWDFVLMLEGALLFAASTTKQLESSDPGVMVAPFTVRQAGVGYGTSAASDEGESRGELWLPLWASAASLTSIKGLLSEGRVRVGRRPARSGIDFARAVASLGVDRGITSFARYGLQVRNGLSYLATPLGRFLVCRRPEVDLLRELDVWLERVRGKARGDTTPSSIKTALRTLDAAIFDLAQGGGRRRLLEVFLRVGQLEASLNHSARWRKDAMVPPAPPLSPRWLTEVDDGSPELRLAAALGSVTGHVSDRGGTRRAYPLRANLEPVVAWHKPTGSGAMWSDDLEPEAIWAGHPLAAMQRVMARRLVQAVRLGQGSYSDHGRLPATLHDVALFVEGAVDLHRLESLLHATVLMDWDALVGDPLAPPTGEAIQPAAIFATMKLCFASCKVRDVTVSLEPRIHRLAVSGDGSAASRLAARRLRGNGLVVAAPVIGVRGAIVERAAAALLFPLRTDDLQRLARLVLRRVSPNNPSTPSTEATHVL